jgi:cupin fold WbuC family metalloprotein
LSEAIFSEESIEEVGPERLRELEERASASPRGRFRLCLHGSVDDRVQEMVNVFLKRTYIRPHRHPDDKAESYHVIRGEMTVFVFDEHGGVERRIEMGSAEQGKVPLYRLRSGRWHAPIPTSETVIFHEVYTGPFDRERDVEEAAWSPEESDAEGIVRFHRALGIDRG